MGIVKIRRRGPGNNNHAQRSFETSTHGDSMPEERVLMGEDPDGDFDDYEFGDIGCELVMVGDQMCSVPYELYSLPDLKEVLSLETWNSCLTEEERFSLAAYLPDMDQETFWLLMKDLLSGDNVFFGSPLEKFFHRLKGGFYSMKVTHFREGLKSLQKREYYHYLRSYHERMTHKFEDMKRTWNTLQPSVSVEERIQIWKRKNQKPLLLVDLNAFPADEDILCKGEKKVATMPSLKITKFINSEVMNTNVPPEVLNGVSLNTKMKAKGVLKIKPLEINSTQNHMAQPLQREPWESCRRPPKGVLKIKRKTDILCQQERSQTFPVPSDQTSADFLGGPKSRFSPIHFANKWHQENFPQGLPFLHRAVKNGIAFTRHELPELINNRQSENFQHTGIDGLLHNLQASQRTINKVNDMNSHNPAEMQREILPLKSKHNFKMYSGEIGGIEEHFDGKNHWQKSSLRSRVFCDSSPESYLNASEQHQERRQMKTVDSTASEATLGIPDINSSKHQPFSSSSVHLEHQQATPGHSNGPKRTAVHITVPDIQRESLMFPITYKRKKPFTKNSMDSLKQPTVVANAEQNVSSRDGHVTEKARTLKIRVKGLNDYNAQYKQGMLNRLRCGSPST